jgi:hypothetical protein
MKRVLVLALCVFSLTTFAQDRYFAQTYTTNVLPKGNIDLEFWHTSRIGHEGQFFNAQDQRLEFEIGLGKNLQTSFYLNRFQERASTGSEGTEVEAELGFSNEWKWKLSDPVANKIGSALYAEIGLKGGDELEVETKVILDKWFGKGKKNVIAFNGTVEFEKEFEWSDNKVNSNGWATPIGLNLAYQYLIKPKFGLGFEIVNRNDMEKGKGWMNSIFYAGPTLNFRGGRYFVILNYMPQLGNIHKTDYSPLKMVLDTHERHEARILFGISL